MSTNLWGSFEDLPTLDTPLSILKDQANHLAMATSGILIGEVDSLSLGAARFTYELDIVAPALNGYRYTAVRISHDIELYPVKVDSPGLEDVVICEDEEVFAMILHECFTSPKIRKVIASLLAQSKA